MTSLSPQAIVKTRRDYNAWVASETLEDYALRFAPRSFRKWSEFRVANTALGSVSFLVLEAIGGSLVINYGFTNAVWAIVIVGIIVFLTGLPISYYAARHNVDMDLLTRGAGFGYLGSTVTSLIYATFTFTLFALEAAIMAQALKEYAGISLEAAYVVSAVVIVPLVIYGVTAINRLQVWTQPLWLILLALPYIAVLYQEPQQIETVQHFAGRLVAGTGFDWQAFGTAATVAFAMVAQIGEQVDFLRFLPDRTPESSLRWWSAVILAGPGWIVIGVLRQLGGALLAVVAIQHGVLAEHAHEPAQMYRIAYGYVFDSPAWALTAMTLLVVVSQIKINVTNAYAGSLAWSNFFSRLTHSHPGRVVWLVFNVIIALILMELGAFEQLEGVLGLLSIVAIAWIGSVVSDLVINKPLGWSPAGIEFKRARLTDFNPVGVVSTLGASTVAIVAYLGMWGTEVRAFAPFLALGVAMVLAPCVAYATRGRFYIAKRVPGCDETAHHGPCCICENQFEAPDNVHCPLYQGTICSLCCTLDARCRDACKPAGRLSDQIVAIAHTCLPHRLAPNSRVRLMRFLLTLLLLSAVVTASLGLILYFDHARLPAEPEQTQALLQATFAKVYVTLIILAGLGAWWIVLNYESRQVAQSESTKQTALLIKEIEDHRKTDAMLKRAREVADRSNGAKSRFLSDMSHEIRTPLNSILGYAEILSKDADIPSRRRVAVQTIHRSGQYLASLVEDILDIARIEARKFELRPAPVRFPAFIDQLLHVVAPQADAKGLVLRCQIVDPLPQAVRADERRLRQILLNLLSNAIKFTQMGSVVLKVGYRGEIARFEVVDTGSGIAAQHLDEIFQPFTRLSHGHGNALPGSGLGLTITKILTEIMGGEITVISELGVGTTFNVRLFLPVLHEALEPPVTGSAIVGYQGVRRTLLVIDDQASQSGLLTSMLEPLGFAVHQAASGAEGLAKVQQLKIDLILMDMIMPELDGLATTQRLRAVGYQNAIVVVSANAYQTDRNIAIAAGCDDFMPKPIRLEQLLNLLQLHLRLDWIYAGEKTAAIDASAALVLPTAAELQDLAAFARMGNLHGLIERLDSLALGDTTYAPLAKHVADLAGEFRLGDIKRLLCEVRHE